MDIETIRDKVLAEEYSFVGHAIVEACKDGIRPQDAKHVLLTGKLIEDYPDRCRCLVSGTALAKISVHVVVEYADYLEDSRQDLVIVTVYVPNPVDWIADKIRKRRR